MRLVLAVILILAVLVAGCTTNTVPKTNESLTSADIEFQTYDALAKYAGYESDVNKMNVLGCSDFIDKKDVESVVGKSLQEPQKIVAPIFSGEYLKYSDYFKKHIIVIICSYEFNETKDNMTFRQNFGFLITYYSAKDRFEDFDQNITGENIEKLDIGRRALIYTNGGGTVDENNKMRYHTVYNVVSVLRDRSMLQVVSGLQKSNSYGVSEEILSTDPQPISRTDLTNLARKINDNLDRKINGI
ncbi:MAG: hypothetical protein HY513_02160 [Candidatus Aenigmarchaeota archaeon]|nr:hypothetical protein [Candidatus Aenigmarchaeota archaeon]